MTDFANFLFVNEIPNKDIAKYLGVSQSYISNVCNGVKKLSKDNMEKILTNPCGWDTSMLNNYTSHSIGNTTIGNNSSNTQIIGENASLKRENELLKQLLEEKERTIQILLNK